VMQQTRATVGLPSGRRSRDPRGPVGTIATGPGRRVMSWRWSTRDTSALGSPGSQKPKPGTGLRVL